jgi:hypothetical protein
MWEKRNCVKKGRKTQKKKKTEHANNRRLWLFWKSARREKKVH